MQRFEVVKWQLDFLDMPSRAQFQQLTDRKLDEAKALLAANFHEGAFYLAGYAVEFALKAVICNRLEIDDIFEGAIESVGVYKGFKTHRLDYLILVSGLSKEIVRAGSVDVNLQVASNPFMTSPSKPLVTQWKTWTEELRYNPLPCPPAEAIKFIDHVETFTTWLKNHW